MNGQADNYLALRVTMVGGLVEEHALPKLGFGWSNAPTIREVLALAPATAEWGKLQAACKRFVKEQEARRKAARLPNPPLEPTLRALFAKVVELRAAYEEEVGPRVTGVALPRVHFERHPPGFTAELWINDPLYAAKGRGTVYVDCRGWQNEVKARCTCRVKCVHALLTLDAVLQWLAEEADETDARVLAMPPWQRLLDAIDAGLGAAAQPQELVLSWRVSANGALTPYEHKPLKRGGLSAGSRVDLHLVPHKAAEHLQRRETFAAFESLIGFPRVFLESNPHRGVTIQRSELGFSLTRGPKGLLHLAPTLAGIGQDPRWLLDKVGEDDDVVLVDDDIVHLFRLKAETRAVLQACVDYPHAFPPDAERALLERLPRLERVTRVELPQELQGVPVVADGRLVLRLFALDKGVIIEGVVTPLDESFRPGEGPETVTAMRDGERVYALRDLRAEKQHAELVVAKLPLPAPLQPWRWQIDTDDKALELLSALKTLDEPVVCHWREETPRKMSVHDVSKVRMHVRENRDWFGLEGDVDIGSERIKLQTLLEGLRKGNRYVRIGLERWLHIESTLRERLDRLNDVIHAGNKLGVEAAPVLRELDEMLDEVTPAWREVQKRLQYAETVDAPPPAALKATLRDYQLQGYQWLMRMAAWGVGAVLADDMGLGKTVQAIAVLLERAHLGPQLVVAPLSVCFNWRRELERFAPTLVQRSSCTVEQAAADSRRGRVEKAQAWRDHSAHFSTRDRPNTPPDVRLDTANGAPNVLVLSYGQVTRDYETLMQQRFATLVLDEAQAVKNADTQRARAVRALQADFKFALSGTPIENHVGELWSILRIVAPGLLGSWEQFRTRFGDDTRRQDLARLIRPFVLRRTKTEVLAELPPRTEVLVSVQQSPEEKRMYEDARLSAVAALASEHVNDVRFEILAALTRLRLLACHPRLFDKTSPLPSSKLEAFLRTAEHLRDNGHKALVFSQFTSHLALVREALKDFTVLMLDGSTPAEERARLVDQFQRGEADLFLISLKAGGFGLNLTAADDVIHLDPWWNPAVEEQATGRAHRIGQTRPVTVYRFVTEGTIEETILALHKDKRELVASLLDGSDSAGKLTSEQLFAMISGR